MTENDPNPVPPSQPRPNPVPDGVSVTPSPRPTPSMGRGDGDDTEQKKMTNPVPAKPRPKTDRCGTHANYVTGCRCTTCRAANATYQRTYRSSRNGRLTWASPPKPTARPNGHGDHNDWPQHIIDHAACRGHTNLFFPPGYNAPNTRPNRTQRTAIAEAKAICAECPVLTECRTWTLNNPRAVYLAVAGGMSWDERRQHHRLHPTTGPAPAAANTSRSTSHPPAHRSAPDHPIGQP
jgi:WhiB family redox-sensing transcriptional regulator